MKCKEIKYLLPDYVKNKLEEYEQLEVSEHLEKCRKCAEEKAAIFAVLQQMDTQTIVQPSEIYWTNLLPRIHDRISRKKKNLLWEIASRGSIPLVTTIVAIFVLVRVFTSDYSNVEQLSTTHITENKAELYTENGDSLSREGLFLVDYLDITENNISSTDVLQKIMLEENQVFESDQINNETTIHTLNDDEVNNLLAILGKGKIN